MTTDEIKQWITKACKHYGCSDAIAKLHFKQYVFEHWNPHPSAKFWKWCNMHPDYRSMRSSGTSEREAKVKMWNCECYNAQYREAKELGVLGEVPRSMQTTEARAERDQTAIDFNQRETDNGRSPF